MPQDLRKQTLDLINANKSADSGQVSALIGAWLAAIDEEDLAGVAPDSLGRALGLHPNEFPAIDLAVIS
eukprot:gene32589-40217_t